MRIQMKLALLVFLVLTASISAVVWKTRTLLIQDKLGFLADSAMKQVAPLKRLTQERLEDQKTRLVKFAAGRASHGPGRVKLPGDYEAIALVQLAQNQWNANWVEKQTSTKADLPTGFEQTLLKSLPYARVRDGETYWARLSDRQGAPLYALLVSVEIHGGATTASTAENASALPDSVDYAAAPTGTGKKAVVVGLMSSAPLADLTEDYIGSTNTVYIIDDKGYVASHVNKAYLGSLFTEDPIVAEIINTRKASASGNYQDLERRDVLGHFERIDRTNLYAIISTPLAPTRNMITLHMRTAITAAAAVGILGLLITWLLGRSLTQEMEVAIAAAKTVRPQPVAPAVVKPTAAPQPLALAPATLSATSPVPAASPATPLTATFANVIKEPVLAILGHAQLVRSKAGDSEQVVAHAESIEREARRAKDTIDRLQAWAEPPSPLRKIEPLDLKELAASVLDECDEQLKAEGIFVAREIHAVPKVRGTAEDIKVALVNLVSNAAEAMRARTKKHLRVVLDLHDDGVHLVVSDTGVGMSRDIKEHVFEPFFKAFETPEHMGLGLSMVQRAMKSMGGSCRIESSPGEGATFTMLLPVTAEDRQLFYTAPLGPLETEAKATDGKEMPTQLVAQKTATPKPVDVPLPPPSERPRHEFPPLERLAEPPAGAAVLDKDDDAFDDEDEKFTNVSLAAKEPLGGGSVQKTLTEIDEEELLKKSLVSPTKEEPNDNEFRVRVRRPRVRS